VHPRTADPWRQLALANHQLLSLVGVEDTRRAICRGAAWLCDAPATRLYEYPGGPAVLVEEHGALAPGDLILESELLAARGQRDGAVSSRDPFAAPAAGSERLCLVRPLRVRGMLLGELAVHVDRPALASDLHEALRYFAESSAAALAAAQDRAALHRLARTDPLTGIANRRGLDEALEARGPGGVAVLFVDFDGLGQLNRALGQAAGDEVIAAVGRELGRVALAGELSARLGGDEFVLVLAEADEGIARSRAAVVAAALDRVTLPDSLRALYGGASIGWAVARSGEDGAAVLGRAEAEMRRAKRARRDGASRG
jgi:diguanylate cyclase (GGDEF)-like protein